MNVRYNSNNCIFPPQNLGSLEISMRFEPREGCLVIAVERGVGLPEHQIKGPPGRSLSSSNSQCRRQTLTLTLVVKFSLVVKLSLSSSNSHSHSPRLTLTLVVKLVVKLSLSLSSSNSHSHSRRQTLTLVVKLSLSLSSSNSHSLTLVVKLSLSLSSSNSHSRRQTLTHSILQAAVIV